MEKDPFYRTLMRMGILLDCLSPERWYTTWFGQEGQAAIAFPSSPPANAKSTDDLMDALRAQIAPSVRPFHLLCDVHRKSPECIECGDIDPEAPKLDCGHSPYCHQCFEDNQLRISC